MDQGWAVVLGAIIALASSSLIPWVRDAVTAKRVRGDERERRIREAVIDLLAANAAQGAAMTTDDDAPFHTAFEARARAAASLLIELPAEDRRGLSVVIDAGSPGRQDGRQKVLALQHTLTAWSVGDVHAADAERIYRDEFARLKARRLT